MNNLSTFSKHVFRVFSLQHTVVMRLMAENHVVVLLHHSYQYDPLECFASVVFNLVFEPVSKARSASAIPSVKSACDQFLP